MSFIKTSQKDIKTFKRSAKKMHQETGELHADCLEKIARQAGYHSWKHVTECAKQTGLDVLQRKHPTIPSTTILKNTR